MWQTEIRTPASQGRRHRRTPVILPGFFYVLPHQPPEFPEAKPESDSHGVEGREPAALYGFKELDRLLPRQRYYLPASDLHGADQRHHVPAQHLIPDRLTDSRMEHQPRLIGYGGGHLLLCHGPLPLTDVLWPDLPHNEPLDRVSTCPAVAGSPATIPGSSSGPAAELRRWGGAALRVVAFPTL